MEEWANGKLGSRSMIFLIFGLNNKQLEYEGIKRQVILKVKLISKLKNIDTITYVWQAIRKEVVRPNPICVSPRCVRAKNIVVKCCWCKEFTQTYLKGYLLFKQVVFAIENYMKYCRQNENTCKHKQ